MGNCFLYGNGGSGGTGLNFSIVGGTEQPASPKENTIWVSTETAVTSWCISQVAPSSPVSGMVWIMNDTGSAISLNVLKKNSIMIWPMSAKQYINGAWVEKTTKIYQNGAWKDFIDWSKWIIKDGASVYDVVAIGKPEDSSFSPQTLKMTQEDGRIKIVCSGSGTGMVYAGPVDLTGINTVTLEGTFSVGSYADWYYMRAWTKIGNYTLSNSAAAVKLTSTGATLNVSKLSGNHYIGFTTRGSLTQYVTNLYLT